MQAKDPEEQFDSTVPSLRILLTEYFLPTQASAKILSFYSMQKAPNLQAYL